MSNKYTAKSFSAKRDLDYIRERPTAHLASVDSAGISHMLREIIDNSNDELALKPEGGTIHIGLFKNVKTNKFQIAIKDDGRGIPASVLKQAVSQIGVSGKFDDSSAYTASSGLFGTGGKVSTALSTRYRAISQNYLEKTSATVIYRDGSLLEENINAPMLSASGVTIVVEPDLSFFENDTVFMNSGFLDLVNTCKQLNIFNEKINFQFYIYEREIPNRFWLASNEEAIEILNDLFISKHKHVEYASDEVDDKAAYLFDIWKLNSSIVFSRMFNKNPLNDKDRLGYNVKLYFAKKPSNSHNAQYFISINNILIPDKTENAATLAVLDILRNNLIPMIEESHYKKFVKDEYRFPTMLLAIGVRFDKAQFIGTTKTSFKDKTFREQFSKELLAQIIMEGPEFWEKLFEIVMPDIALRYAQAYDVPTKKVDDKRMFSDLLAPNNYHECRSYVDAEIFITEGDSAGILIENRNVETQAIFLAKGKPLNASTTIDKLEENRKVILKDPMYRDLMKILNINQNTTDFSTARFKRIIIASDADPDGYHIRSLHLNNLSLINPGLIESGMVWLANPPLYTMEITKRKRIHLRDKIALTDARIEYIYKQVLDIDVVTSAGLTHLKDTKDDTPYRDLCYLVEEIGNQYKKVADQLGIDLLILERLVFAAEHLYPKINYIELARCFESADGDGYIRIQVNETGRFIILSIGNEDKPISLEKIGETIINHLLPLDKKYKIRELLFQVTSKHKGSQFHKAPMSMLMLYICLQTLNTMFEINRYKGLGEMSSEDCFETIMNPDTRSLTQITSLGDLKETYKLIGKDSTERKRLLSNSNILTNSFRA